MHQHPSTNRTPARARATVTVAALALTITGLAAAPRASAATPGVWFYATDARPNGTNGLVKVELKGGKIVAVRALAHARSTKTSFFPTAALGSHSAGVEATYDQATFGYKQALFVWDAVAKKLHKLTSTKTDQVISPSLYNKGRSVAYIDQRGSKYTLRTMSASGAARTIRYTVPLGYIPTSLAVSNDGKRFYFGAIKQGATNYALIYRWTLGTHRQVAMIKQIKEAHIDVLSLSPNNKTLAFGPGTFPPPKHGVRTVSVLPGGITKGLPPQGEPATLSWSATGTTIYYSDQAASGWSQTNVATAHNTAENAASTGKFTHPVRA